MIANLRCLCFPARAIHALQSAAVTTPRAQRGSTTKPSAGPHDPLTIRSVVSVVGKPPQAAGRLIMSAEVSASSLIRCLGLRSPLGLAVRVLGRAQSEGSSINNKWGSL
jgi:hypothetical protein